LQEGEVKPLGPKLALPVWVGQAFHAASPSVEDAVATRSRFNIDGASNRSTNHATPVAALMMLQLALTACSPLTTTIVAESAANTASAD
jgi:hypothetical protein